MRAQPNSRPLSQGEMVLLAMFRFSNATEEPIPYAGIVLQAWRDYPELFGLPGHPEHPDASDIHKKLYGNLKSNELVESLGNKVFRLTAKGIEQARVLANQEPVV